ncbi:acyl-CoA dehydrogenase family protein [Salipiger bermudensis]|uniref:acyl-CoA dehydrogenase family protein n=1 Tax=Salipiger bermudensis TaxID=344736 RepID=UPI001CD63C5C|nr:acyl-CoA dehydrogenase family protein [Salipiger bermudensis]MCA0961827.1 acyl-CoA/acyl-ACP dehydrogenase [Salipiger bermudensis]
MRQGPATATETPTEADALKAVAEGALDADAGARDLSEDMRRLADSGILARLCTFEGGPEQIRAQATLLRRIGRASLSVGRLAEGHMNALKLVTLYGTPEQVQRHISNARNGAIYGVWGADAAPPVTVSAELDGRLRLAGGKRFASGLGTVSHAVVTAQYVDGLRLALAEVTHPERADASAWDTSGMRATASGSYDFNGLTAEALGAADAYLREPHFQGGVWRYAAVQTGGLEALAEEVRRAVSATASPGEAQLHRLARIAGLAHRARLMVEDAALRVETPGAGPEAVALSLAAREEVEQACLDGIALADRALGTRSFAKGQRAELVRRDLGFFLRQADLDGKLRQVGAALCAAKAPIGEVWAE